MIQSDLFIPGWRSLNHLKGSLNHPKKGTLNHQVTNVYHCKLKPEKMAFIFYSCQVVNERQDTQTKSDVALKCSSCFHVLYFSWLLYMGVSKNSGTPKSSILIGFSIFFHHPFWGTPICTTILGIFSSVKTNANRTFHVAFAAVEIELLPVFGPPWCSMEIWAW